MRAAWSGHGSSSASGGRTRRRRRARRRQAVSVYAVVLAVFASFLTALVTTTTTAAQAAASCPGGLCKVTVDARDLLSGAALAHFNFVVNVDNTKLASDPLALSTESNSPIAAEGTETHNQVQLPAGRYLISVRAVDHKMWGDYINLPADAAADGTLTKRIDLSEQSDAHPLPLGKIRVFVFEDNAWANGAPDTEEAGLSGFKVGLEEQTNSAVTVDYNNNPLCGGQCLTATDGFVQINDLGPATYFIDVHPPDQPCNSDPNSRWYQTTTIDGGLQLLAPVEEGSDGTGAPGEQLWEPPNNRTAYWFGFVCAPQPFTNPGTGEITGRARNWVEWAPYTTGTFNEPVPEPFVALSDATTDRTVYIGRGDADGNFDIQGVPAGSYNLAIWDEQLTYIMRFKPITIAVGQTVDVNDVGDDGEPGIGVSRWFGWLDGTVYKDQNGNGQYDAGVDTPIPNTDMDQR
jgi:large repetitive protein